MIVGVKNKKEVLKKKPNYLLLFSWHISKELIGKIKKKGFKGKFIIPLPTPKIIS